MNKVQLKKLIKLFVLGIFVFSLLMILVYCIPDAAVYENTALSIGDIYGEGEYPTCFMGSEAFMLDNFTDRITLDMNIQDTSVTNPIYGAFYNNNYPRYWHGRQIILRPLLCFFNFHQIRYINIFVMMFLFLYVLNLLNKNYGIKTAMVFAAVILSSAFIIVPFSMQFSSMFLVMFCSIICLCKLKENNKLTFDNSVLLFAVTGMLTNFLDLLTTPLITLGIPLVLYVASTNKEFKTLFKETVILIIVWFLFYGFTWGAKWILSSIILEENIILDAFKQMKYRSDLIVDDTNISYLEVLGKQIKYYCYPLGKTIFAMKYIFLLATILPEFIKAKYTKSTFKLTAIYLIIFVLPFVWYFVLGNHSAVHYWFTYRTLSVSDFALLMSLIAITKQNKIIDNV